MAEETNMQDVLDLAYLVGCAVDGLVPNQDRVAAMDLDAVHTLASQHTLKSATAMALESAGLRNKWTSTAIGSAVRKAAIFSQAFSDVKTELARAEIWYLPLKGAVLKDLYPKMGMREFCDHDILFDAERADDVKAIMEGLGFTTEHFGASNHDVYHKRPVLNFEMHRSLFGSGHDEKLYEYYRSVESRLLGDGCEKHLGPEDFYLYFLAHEYKHYSNGGTGLRSILDTYVYLRAEKLDMEYVAAEAEKLGIDEFEEKNRSLALHLFGGEELTEADLRMLGYVASSGTYGTVSHSVSNKLRKNGWSKPRYMLRRFLVPVSKKNADYGAFASTYPFFYKHKALLWTLPFYRVARAAKEGRFQSEARAIRNAKNEAQPE